MIRVIQDQPDDAQMKDILKELEFFYMTHRGLADSHANRVINHEVLKTEMHTWRR